MSEKLKKKNKRSQRSKPGHVSLQVWNVPSEVKMKFKAACARSGDKMEAVIIKMMKNYTAGKA